MQGKIFLNSEGHSWLLVSLKGSIPLVPFIFWNQHDGIVPLLGRPTGIEFPVTQPLETG